MDEFASLKLGSTAYSENSNQTYYKVWNALKLYLRIIVFRIKSILYLLLSKFNIYLGPLDTCYFYLSILRYYFLII